MLAEQFISALGGKAHEVIFDGASRPPWEVADSVMAAKPTQLVIAAHGRYSVREADYSLGIELVLWFRLKHGLTCPILLVGFPSKAEVLTMRKEQTERFLLHAPGIRYVQLPVPPDQWPELKEWLDKSEITKEDIEKEYPHYLRAGFDIGNFRHALANKFGLKATWDVHFASTAAQKTKYPDGLRNCLDQEKDLLITQALYPLEDGLIGQAITDLRTSVKKSGVRTAVPPGLKLLHVDDEIHLGWGKLIQRMLNAPDSGTSNYQPYQPAALDQTSIVEAVLAKIRDNDPSVVLLDLRLRKEDENLARSDSPPSGIAVLRAIRAEYMTLPVIVTTASNKLWSYRMVMHEGADGYWLKQGVEYGWGTNETFDSYLDLCHMLACITESPLIKSLRRMELAIQWMTVAANQWWSVGAWKTNERRNGDTESSKYFLEMAMSDLQNYCRSHVLFRGSTPSRQERALALASMCIKIGSAAECIVSHGLADWERHRRIDRCESQPLKALFSIRNDAAHSRALVEVDEAQVIRQVGFFDEFIHNGCI